MEIGILKGDGIGPEVVPAAKRCIESTQIDVSFLEIPVGWEAYEKYGSSVPESSILQLKECDGWILGPTMAGDYPADDEAPMNPSGWFRKRYDLYANVRPVQSYDKIGPPDMNLTIFRQNTEGFYADRNMYCGNGQFMPTEDVSLSVRVVTRKKCRQIAEDAFAYASQHGKDITAVHKANVLDQGDGLFIEECQAVAKEYPEIKFESTLVDAFAFELVRDPSAHEIIVTTNLYGDILSDEAAGIIGSLGLAPSINYGDTHAMAQATHGAAPDIAGKGIANPAAMILSAAMLFDWLGERGQSKAKSAAETIHDGVRQTIDDGVRTPDLGGNTTTNEFTDAVISKIHK